MNIISKKTRTFLINLFADFILNKIPTEEFSIIEVVDCENFYVVKGKTSYTEILDLNKIKDEFLLKYPELKNEKKLLNTIDLIDYGIKMIPVVEFKNIFFNSSNCSFHSNQIESFKKEDNKNFSYDGFTKELEDELVLKSNFPYGHSLGMGRLLYYLCKHLVYNIPANFPFEKIIVKIPSLDFENNLVFEDESGSEIESLKSLFLDCFDFNLIKFEEEIKKLDWSEELTNPTEDFEFLKRKIDGIILV